MSPVILTLASVLLVSAISFIGVLGLALNERSLRKILFILVSLAVGALLGDAFIHLIPESFAEGIYPPYVGLLIIAGMLLFFGFEKILHWHHLHGDHEHDQSELHTKHEHMPGHEGEHYGIHPTGYMILASDGLHNFLDGIIIAVSFLAGPGIGVASTIAIILHEIPQEIGDFGVLLHSGFSRGQALLVNFLSALLAVLGGAIALFLGGYVEQFVPFIVPIAAGGFLYIATADLIPELHKQARFSQAITQFIAIVTGVALMFLLLPLENYLVPEDHGEGSAAPIALMDKAR